MSEKYISPAEREYIAKAWGNYASVAEIATHLGKSRKTIYAELRRGQDGVLFWIRENQILRRRGLPCYYVAANDTKGKGRTVFTGDHEHFTLEGAKELCQQIMAGEANLGERKARYAAEDAEKERRAVAEATEQAENFRGRLEAAGISFGELLELEDAMDDLSLMARNILLGWENGEGFPHE